jgi:arylformamidase
MQLDKARIFDISPLISPRTAVFPGDTAFQQNFLLEMSKGHNLTLSSITTTVHLGAHADAPSHYALKGQTSAQTSLRPYLGQCEVKSVNVQRGARILMNNLVGWVPRAERVLFATGTFPNPDQWNNNFAALSPEVIEFLVKHNVCLVGIDTPSVDPADDKVLLSHNAIAKNNLSILEGLVLDEAKDGLYTLIALPLRIEGSDASPVRAILLEDRS